MISKIEIEEQAESFLELLFQDLDRQQIVLKEHWDIDHLCFRVETAESYEHYKQAFEKFAQLLVESPVNGRPISTYKLNEPIHFRDQEIHLIELPAPKPGKSCHEGFEHIEIVCDIPFEELKKKYRHLTIDESGLQKEWNQELEIQLGPRNLKFHLLSLESVIRLETHKDLFEALNTSNLLKLLKPFQPLIAGTFPLGLQLPGSDLDILLKADDLEELSIFLTSHFRSYPGFSMEKQWVDDRESLLVRFSLSDIPIEIFAQDLEPVLQKAYRHFLVEERILKKGGNKLLDQVKMWRARGLKTEEAFAKVLNLEGDPYESLLVRQRCCYSKL